MKRARQRPVEKLRLGGGSIKESGPSPLEIMAQKGFNPEEKLQRAMEKEAKVRETYLPTQTSLIQSNPI